LNKYEYKVRSEEIKNLISIGKYDQAVDIADTIDWRRVKNIRTLCTISDLYKINRRFEESKEILLLAYSRNPNIRAIVYSLCELSIKMGEFVQAVEYYKEFVRIAPRDTGRYILQYRLYEAQEVSLEERIAVLEEFKKHDYRAKWAYELAFLYHRMGLTTKCVEEIDEMSACFGSDKYVIKALDLKALHEPLSQKQRQLYDEYNMYKRGVAESFDEEDINEHEESLEDTDLKKRTTKRMYDSNEDAAKVEEAAIRAGMPPVDEMTRIYNAKDVESSLNSGGASAYQNNYFGNQNVNPYGNGYNSPNANLYENVYANNNVNSYGNRYDAGQSTNPYGNIYSDNQNVNSYANTYGENQTINPYENAYTAEQNAGVYEKSYHANQNAGTYGNAYTDNAYTNSFYPNNNKVKDDAVKVNDAPKPVGFDTINLTRIIGDDIARICEAEERERQNNVINENSDNTDDITNGGFYDTTGNLYADTGNLGYESSYENNGNDYSYNEINAQSMGYSEGADSSRYDDILTQETDGQISMALPDAPKIDDQITGQISIEDIMNNIKEQQQKRQEKNVDKLFTEKFNNMMSDYEESAKYDLQKEIEQKVRREIKESHRQKVEKIGTAPKFSGNVIRTESDPYINVGENKSKLKDEFNEALGLLDYDKKIGLEVEDLDVLEEDISLDNSIKEINIEEENKSENENSEPVKKEDEEEENAPINLSPKLKHTAKASRNYSELKKGTRTIEPEGRAYDERALKAMENLSQDIESEEEKANRRAEEARAAVEERARLLAEKREKERKEREEKERLQKEQEEKVRLQKEQEEKVRLQKEEERERLSKEQEEKDKIEQEEKVKEEEAENKQTRETLDVVVEKDMEIAENEELVEDVIEVSAENEVLDNIEELISVNEDGEIISEDMQEIEEVSDSENVQEIEDKVSDLENSQESKEEAGILENDHENSDFEASTDSAEDSYSSLESVQENDSKNDALGEAREFSTEGLESADSNQETQSIEETKDETGENTEESLEEGELEAKDLDTRVRVMTPEEKELFGPYIHHRKSRKQIIKAIDSLNMSPATNNAIVTGEEGTGTLNLAKGLIKSVQAGNKDFSGKVAKITAQSLNKKSVPAIIEKLGDGALIIQRAADMKSDTVESLYDTLKNDKKGIIIVLEDNLQDMNRLLKRHSQLNECFNVRVDVEALDNDSLVSYAKQYALEKEYSIDALGVLSLHSRIENMQTIDHDVTITEVREIVDEAIENTKKKTIGHLFDVVLNKRYDDDDMIILTEKDFELKH